MVSRCANPECGAHFHRLGQGRLFHFEVASKQTQKVPQQGLRLVTTPRSTPKVEHFWLCSKCAGRMTLKFDKNGVTVVSLHRHMRAAAS